MLCILNDINSQSNISQIYHISANNPQVLMINEVMIEEDKSIENRENCAPWHLRTI